MNEFIVWDKVIKKFWDYENIHEGDRPSLGNDNVFAYISKKDINNKKIYADCSIVEFAHRYVKDDYSHDCILRGVFTYSEDKLCYVIELLPNDIYKVNFLSFNENSGLFQIIDTIQENKLGLIKQT